MSRNRGGHVLGLDLVRIKNVADGPGDERRIHDGAVHDCILRQGFQTETNEFVPVFRAFQLHGFNGAGADVQTDESLLFIATKHGQTPQESCACRIFPSLLPDPLKQSALENQLPEPPSHPHMSRSSSRRLPESTKAFW